MNVHTVRELRGKTSPTIAQKSTSPLSVPRDTKALREKVIGRTWTAIVMKKKKSKSLFRMLRNLLSKFVY